MRLRELLIKNLDKILDDLRKNYKGGPQVLFQSVETKGYKKAHRITLIIQIEEDCQVNAERRENAKLN